MFVSPCRCAVVGIIIFAAADAAPVIAGGAGGMDVLAVTVASSA